VAGGARPLIDPSGRRAVFFQITCTLLKQLNPYS
jgi:hypothetical protein